MVAASPRAVWSGEWTAGVHGAPERVGAGCGRWIMISGGMTRLPSREVRARKREICEVVGWGKVVGWGEEAWGGTNRRGSVLVLGGMMRRHSHLREAKAMEVEEETLQTLRRVPRLLMEGAGAG